MTAQNLQRPLEWQVQRFCTDIEDYELIVEQQKTNWECEQTRESWKWVISYHGSIVASGTGNTAEEAKKLAEKHIPL